MSEVVPLLLVVGGFAFVVSLVLAPMESLGWWAGWLGPQTPGDAATAPDATATGTDRPACFVVFLSGIGSSSGNAQHRSESDFLDRLQAELPEVRIVRDVFPYAPSGRPLLTGQRVFTWLWERVRTWRQSGTRLLPAILNMRNLFQVLVSADHRYGPLYGFGISGVVRERLAAHGYPAGSGVPVVLLGSSGGGQISVGAAGYLGDEIAAPLSIVTFGGVMSSDASLADITRLTSLYGRADRVYALGRTAFPGRWPVAKRSFWNTARSEDRLVERAIGPMGHSGRGGYLDAAPRADGGAAYVDVTVREVAAAIRDSLPAAALPRGG